MQTGNRVRVVSDHTVDFTGTLAQNAGVTARIKLPEAIAAGRHARAIIESIQVVSADQLDWEFWFWANQQGLSTGHPDLEVFLGFWSFTVAGGDGKQIGATGFYHYYIDGLGIAYWDLDAQANATAAQAKPPLPPAQQGAFLNVTLVNRSGGAKTTGWFQAAFTLHPSLGW